jgi:hypothetical protein
MEERIILEWILEHKHADWIREIQDVVQWSLIITLYDVFLPQGVFITQFSYGAIECWAFR